MYIGTLNQVSFVLWTDNLILASCFMNINLVWINIEFVQQLCILVTKAQQYVTPKDCSISFV